ncbi:MULTISPECIES: DedA family protein [unclassified Novosphingobium]|uniref:DedA family protein n=1 Tax=unclassified Novosphingobium TaxID=2644732 RepID=UPI001358FF6E|nr:MULTISPECIES: DedA family protein [unclassified Novosphingobium]
MSLEQIITEYGLVGLALGAGLEGETVVVIGGLMTHRGILPFWPSVAAAAAGSFLADQLFFLLGRRFREHRFVRGLQRRPAFARALTAFNRHPVLFVFAFRFLYGLRTVSPLAIGTTLLSARKFLAINAAAAIVWALVFVTVGHWFGQAIEAEFGRIKSLEHLVGGALAIAAIIGIAVLLVRKNRAAGSSKTDG